MPVQVVGETPHGGRLWLIDSQPGTVRVDYHAVVGGSLPAPTAGGKTEAAVFPLLTAMAADGWGAPSLVYVAPLKALLNNLLPQLEACAGWLGRRAAL